MTPSTHLGRAQETIRYTCIAIHTSSSVGEELIRIARGRACVVLLVPQRQTILLALPTQRIEAPGVAVLATKLTILVPGALPTQLSIQGGITPQTSATDCGWTGHTHTKWRDLRIQSTLYIMHIHKYYHIVDTARRSCYRLSLSAEWCSECSATT